MNLAVGLWEKNMRKCFWEKRCSKKMVILNRKNDDFINIGTNKDGGVRYNKSVVGTGEQLHKIGDVTNNPVGKL